MTFDDLQQQWQDSNESAARPAVDPDTLLRTCRRTEKFKSEIFRRDFMEIAAGILVIFWFGTMTFKLASWVSKIGSFICVCGAIFIIYKLQRGRKVQGDSRFDVSVREYCRIEIERIKNQIHLIQTIASWYIAPCIVGANLVYAGSSSSWLASSIYLVCTVLFSWFIYALNQRAVAKQFVPLYEELKSLEKELDDPKTGDPAADT